MSNFEKSCLAYAVELVATDRSNYYFKRGGILYNRNFDRWNAVRDKAWALMVKYDNEEYGE